jgi:hypothetical protein
LMNDGIKKGPLSVDEIALLSRLVE